MDKPRISVVGSTNIDLVTYLSRVPNAGETVIGERFQMGFGGKGANQAVMAALLGARVEMVTCVGTDDYGAMNRANFKSYGIDISAVYSVEGSSGVAPIWVEPDGSNRIVVVPGSNHALTEDQARSAVKKGSPQIVIGQFEIPQGVTAAAFEAAKTVGSLTVLNPAPADGLIERLLRCTDWLIPNEHELSLLGCGPADADLTAFAHEMGVRLLVTLGSEGVALVEGEEVVRLAAPPVSAVDTTGAGDAFVGAFAFGLGIGMEPRPAAQLGMVCASDSVTREGTQSSYPSFERCVDLMTELQ